MERKTQNIDWVLMEAYQQRCQDTPMLHMIATMLRENLDTLSRGRFNKDIDRSKVCNEITQLHALAHAAVELCRASGHNNEQPDQEEIVQIEPDICKAKFLLLVSQLKSNPSDSAIQQQLNSVILQAYQTYDMEQDKLITLLSRDERDQLHNAGIETNKHRILSRR